MTPSRTGDCCSSEEYSADAQLQGMIEQEILKSPEEVQANDLAAVENAEEVSQRRFTHSSTSKKSNYEPNLFKALDWSCTKPLPT